MTDQPLDPDYRRIILNADREKDRPLLRGDWTPDTWRPPAMTADLGPLLCPECRDDKHGNCDGTSWSEVDDAPADCPCSDPVHAGTDLGENPYLPPEYAEALEKHEARIWTPPGCTCVVVYDGPSDAHRTADPDCPIPEGEHEDHRREDSKSKRE